MLKLKETNIETTIVWEEPICQGLEEGFDCDKCPHFEKCIQEDYGNED